MFPHCPVIVSSLFPPLGSTLFRDSRYSSSIPTIGSLFRRDSFSHLLAKLVETATPPPNSVTSSGVVELERTVVGSLRDNVN